MTYTRAGDAVVVHNNGRELAIVRPTKRTQLIGVSTIVLVMVGAMIVAQRPTEPPFILIATVVIAAAQLVWGLWGTTEVDVEPAAVVVRRRLFRLSFFVRRIRIASPLVARHAERLESVKGAEVVRHCVVIVNGAKHTALPMRIDSEGAEAVVDMLNRHSPTLTGS